MSNNTTAINQYQPYLKMLPSILKYCSSLVGADLADIIQYYLLLDLNNSTANKKNMIKQLNIIYFGLKVLENKGVRSYEHIITRYFSGYKNRSGHNYYSFNIKKTKKYINNIWGIKRNGSIIAKNKKAHKVKFRVVPNEVWANINKLTDDPNLPTDPDFNLGKYITSNMYNLHMFKQYSNFRLM
tara:strand:+ start:75 stop:626 length:552 start_codon:yes stop_codon:yes gene_type:complete